MVCLFKSLFDDDMASDSVDRNNHLFLRENDF